MKLIGFLIELIYELLEVNMFFEEVYLWLVFEKWSDFVGMDLMNKKSLLSLNIKE